MMVYHYSSDACVEYCIQNERLQVPLQIIQAVLDGMLPNEIIKLEIAPDLSPRTIEYYYNKYKKITREG